jgi:hypothetical protein
MATSNPPSDCGVYSDSKIKPLTRMVKNLLPVLITSNAVADKKSLDLLLALASATPIKHDAHSQNDPVPVKLA